MAEEIRAYNMATLIWQRDVADVKSTFSSWDKCMTKTYCKSVYTT
jgi:hypothetical protein